jgi:hypothetical protein
MKSERNLTLKIHPRIAKAIREPPCETPSRALLWHPQPTPCEPGNRLAMGGLVFAQWGAAAKLLPHARVRTITARGTGKRPPRAGSSRLLITLRVAA